MKRFSPIMLFIMSLLIIVTLASCNKVKENELNLSNVESEISEIENNENQSQQDESVEDINDSAKNFEFVLLSDETYGIKKLLNTTATDLTIPEHYNGKAVIEDQLKNGVKKKLVGLKMVDRGIARHGNYRK